MVTLSGTRLEALFDYLDGLTRLLIEKWSGVFGTRIVLHGILR